MAITFIPFIYTAILALICIVLVPRNKIRRLAIYGIIFGAAFDVVLLLLTNSFGEIGYFNYGPFGLLGIHFISPIAWAIFFIMYFYFLPNIKLYQYIYITVGILASIAFAHTITQLGILYLTHGTIDAIFTFLIWYPAATWGYAQLLHYVEGQQPEEQRARSFMPHPQPARKPIKQP